MKTKYLSEYLEHLRPLIREVKGGVLIEIAGATNDSRKVRPGWLFVAVSGTLADGHHYIEQALVAGAVAVISEKELDMSSAVACVRVTDAYAAAAGAAEVMYDFPACNLQLIGITGTNGKTTTAFLLREIFLQLGEKVGMIGTVGYDCGGTWEAASRTTPDPFVLQALFREMVKNGCHRAVLEVSSHALLQSRLGSSRFGGAVFTNLSGDHLDYHRSMENYYLAKRVLFQTLLNDDAVIVLNGDDPYGRRLQREITGCQMKTWGRLRRDQDYVLRIVREGLFGQVCQLTGCHEARRWCAPLVGRYNADNMAAAALMARGLGISWDVITAAFRATVGVPGRLQAVAFPNHALALVDYAHTDDALLKVLQTLKSLPHRRLLVVFGCGGDRDRGKRPRMGRVAAAFADHIIITNDNPRNEDPRAIADEIVSGVPFRQVCEVILDRRQALEAAVKMLQPYDLLLVAGKGHEDYQEIGGEKTFFDDRVELLRLCREMENSSFTLSPPAK
ncbi:MAG: UDP-N-acetylmuramoyl-L-alanyl-D-glutamate--2,6-diaminopimelate ligase [Deltaproteobacteria bacterium]|nr:UDP-N-acetylmuramoyl-L-alanyl-D-glutamate--2,6-diaminopimelate ligase [Deltaproteobacteria bacterium]